MFRKNKSFDALDVFRPVEQTRRVLDSWLKAEGRQMPRRERQRLSGLLARYFQHEDDVSDTLILSFLDRFAGKGAVDMEDPGSVRAEIQSLIDMAKPLSATTVPASMAVVLAGGILSLVVLLGLLGWRIYTLPMTAQQQSDLRLAVEQAAIRRGDKNTAAIWAAVKKPLGVRKYEDITYWQADDAIRFIETEIKP